jgi:hypothetical protein
MESSLRREERKRRQRREDREEKWIGLFCWLSWRWQIGLKEGACVVVVVVGEVAEEDKKLLKERSWW